MSVQRKAASVLINLLNEDDPMRDFLSAYYRAELESPFTMGGEWKVFDTALFDMEAAYGRLAKVVADWQEYAENAEENAANEKGDHDRDMRACD
jgi:hypothetical protein